MTNLMQDFYGFNGFRSVYSVDSVAANSAFYKMDQNKFHLMADFQGDFPVANLKWLLGYGLYNYSIGTVNREKHNNGKPVEEQIPDRPGLYQKYVEWGLISPDEQNGGMLNLIKAGFMYDSRNAKTNPSKGIFTEALLEVAPPLLNESPYVNYIVMHRQYQSLIETPTECRIAYWCTGQDRQQGSSLLPQTSIDLYFCHPDCYHRFRR